MILIPALSSCSSFRHFDLLEVAGVAFNRMLLTVVLYIVAMLCNVEMLSFVVVLSFAVVLSFGATSMSVVPIACSLILTLMWLMARW